VAQRKRYASKARHRREQTYLEARASLDAFKEDVRQGRIVAPPVQVIEAMEREVLALLP
jgi:hypothetical protein